MIKSELKSLNESAQVMSDKAAKVAAKYFALSNMGQLKKPFPTDEKSVNTAYDRFINQDDEAYNAAEDERKEWLKDITKGDKATIKMVREDIPWVFDIK